ncbi:MAG: hypothetical protein IKG27_02455 [Bacilli bacterium]|nr:hypothetical protein [Bacilli bacterium]
MQEKPLKNYIILAVIMLSVVLLVFYIRGWYNTSKVYYSRNSVIKNVAREINAEEISNYTLESQKFILYVSSGSDISIKEFENDLKKLILRLDIAEDVLYLNLDNVNISDFNVRLRNVFADSERIKSRISDDSTASFYVFENGKIVSLLNNVDSFNIEHIKRLFQKWGFDND